MPFDTLNIGTAANDGTGDTLRTAFGKVQNNFGKPALIPYGVPTVAPAANQIAYYSAATAVTYTALTAFGRSLIDDADAGAARATLGAAAYSATSLGAADMDAAPLGQLVPYNGTADQGATLNWPSIGDTGTAAQWWNVLTHGTSTRATQTASFGFGGSRGRTFVRGKHDATWSAWQELQQAGSAFLAQLRAPDGTAPAPSITFASDTNTGIYRFGENQLAVSAQGATVARFRVTSATEGNYVDMINGGPGARATYGVEGVDANISANVRGKGTGSVFIGSGTNVGIEVSAPTSTVNYVRARGAATGVGPDLTVIGGDANAPLTLAARGNDSVLLASQGGTATALRASAPATGVNRIGITGSATGQAVTIAAEGADANIAVFLAPKGTGTLDATSKRVTSVANPTAAQDAATKAYVDEGPSILERVNTATQNLGSNPTAVVIQFPSAGDFVRGLAWDGTNHRCQPTVSGIYMVVVNVILQMTNASAYVLDLAKNGTLHRRFYQGQTAASAVIAGGSGTCFVECNGTTDYIDIRATIPAGGLSNAGATAAAAQEYSRVTIKRVGALA